MLTALWHAGAAGLKLVEIPELSESKATADSPISAHTKVSHASRPCPAARPQHGVSNMTLDGGVSAGRCEVPLLLRLSRVCCELPHARQLISHALQVAITEASIGAAGNATKEAAKAPAAVPKRSKRARAPDTPSSIQSRPPLAIRPPAWSGASCGGPMVTGPMMGMGPTHCYMQVCACLSLSLQLLSQVL